jgi:hypothetical protein
MMQEGILRHFKVFVEERRWLHTPIMKKGGVKGIAAVSRRGADDVRWRRSFSDLYAN